MLNITENTIRDRIKLTDFKSYELVAASRGRNWMLTLLAVMLVITAAGMFLPWTQNINAKGYVTTRSPESRPQGIQAVIPGRIERWYIQEGDFVHAGDTIAYLTEVKSDYFDPDLVGNTESQADAKQQSASSYGDKLTALQSQYAALREQRKLKLDQLTNKIQQTRKKVATDSADLVAQQAKLAIARNQVERVEQLYSKGLKSLSELQEKQSKVAEADAKVNAQRNKLDNQRSALQNAIIEQPLIERSYAEKLAKVLSDQQSAIAGRAQSLSDVAKLRSQVSSYSARQHFYYLLAPQDGFVTKTVKTGIGEMIKEGDDIATIVPADYDLAVELYVDPQDLPLLHPGEDAILRFDGWPVLVISGWPESSTGTFRGEVVAIDRFIGSNGKYRILISPDPGKRAWPEQLRVGTGSQAFILLEEVPVWWEFWRRLNGFPAEYYDPAEDGKPKDLKMKEPIRSIK